MLGLVKIKSLLAHLVGLDQPCSYHCIYENTSDILKELDRDFNKNIADIKDMTDVSLNSFDISIKDYKTEIQSLIQPCEVKKNAGGC